MFRWAFVVVVLSTMSACASRQLDDSGLEPAVDEREMATQAYARGDFNAARRHLGAHLTEHQEDVEALLMLGNIWLEQQRPERAKRSFDQVLTLQPENVDAKEGKALALLARGETEQADEYFAALLEERPERWRSWNGRGVIADMQGDYERARAAYRKALASGGDNEAVANNLGYSMIMSGDLRDAAHWLGRALEDYPGSLRLRNNLALALARNRRYQGAMSELRVVMPEHEALNNVGYIAMLNGDYEIAVDLLRKATEVSPRYYPRAEANLLRAVQARDQAGDD